MKKIFLTICLFAACMLANAQSTFDKKIADTASKVESATKVQELDALFLNLSSMAKENNVNRWKAYYYAGLTQYRKAALLIKSNNISGATEANAMAFKYASAVPTDNSDGQKLLNQISEQRLTLKRVFAFK